MTHTVRNSRLCEQVVHKPITRIIRLSFITILTLHDVGYAIYVRLYDPSNRCLQELAFLLWIESNFSFFPVLFVLFGINQETITILGIFGSRQSHILIVFSRHSHLMVFFSGHEHFVMDVKIFS